MAFTALTPLTVIQESEDALELKIWDASTWTGESGNVTAAKLVIAYYQSDGTLITYDDYDLIQGADKTRWNSFLDHHDGLVIPISDLTIDGEAAGDRFIDGLFVITAYFNDGSYTDETMPYYANYQAFLAKFRFMSRKLAAVLLVWPITDDVIDANYDIFAFRMYLDAAEDAADNGKTTEFQTFINLLTGVLTYYAIEECW